MEPIIRVDHLTHTYSAGTPFQRSAVQDMSLDILPGEFLGIIGHTGSGKSTLIQHLNGLLKPTSGEVLLDGQDIWSDKKLTRAARFRVGLVFQYPEYQLFEETVYKDIAFGPTNMGLSKEEIDRRVREAAGFVGLTEKQLEVSPFDLSGGQKRRVAIAGVIAMEPEVLILDEPTAGQDFRHYTDIMEFLRGLNEQGVTVVMITHDMHLMLEYTPRALVFCDGQLIADRSAAAVLCDPELIEQAALKETSLFTLANRCGIAPAEDFVERFIHEDREVRTHGC